MKNQCELVDANDIIKKSRRFDLIFKFELAHAWAYGTASEIRTAEEAYLEMVRARNGFRESEPPRSGPKEFLDSFRKTATSIFETGYDLASSPVPIDVSGEILNGAHRLASCAAYGRRCLVQWHPQMSTGCSEINAFYEGRMSLSVLDWGLSAYLKRFPDGCLAGDYEKIKHSETSFPDWSDHAESLRYFSLKWRFYECLYRIKASLRFGMARERSLKHADKCHHKAVAPRLLANYWKNKGAE